MLIRRALTLVGAVVLAGNVVSLGQSSIGINFGADEYPANPGAGTLAASDIAGVVPQGNWNNLAGAVGAASGLWGDDGVATTASVSWSSPNTWSSTGRGEENNLLTGPNRTLLIGYLDTGDNSATAASVTVSGLPAAFASGGYNVIVYALGGVGGRGGGYTIGGTTLIGTAPFNPTDLEQDAGVDMTDVGNYLVFSGLTGDSFTLVADATLGNFRAPINGIQIVAVPEPGAIALLAVSGCGLLALIRLRR